MAVFFADLVGDFFDSGPLERALLRAEEVVRGFLLAEEIMENNSGRADTFTALEQFREVRLDSREHLPWVGSIEGKLDLAGPVLEFA